MNKPEKRVETKEIYYEFSTQYFSERLGIKEQIDKEHYLQIRIPNTADVSSDIVRVYVQ